MGKNLQFLPVLKTWRVELAKCPAAYVQAGLLLAFFCNEQRNGGKIPDAQAWLSDELSRSSASITRAMAKLILCGDSALWRWVGETLEVLLYSTEYEDMAARKSERMKALASLRKNVGGSGKARTQRKNAAEERSDTTQRKNVSEEQTDEINSLSKDRESLSLSRTRPDCESDSSGPALVTETSPSRPPRNAEEVLRERDDGELRMVGDELADEIDRMNKAELG